MLHTATHHFILGVHCCPRHGHAPLTTLSHDTWYANTGPATWDRLLILDQHYHTLLILRSQYHSHWHQDYPAANRMTLHNSNAHYWLQSWDATQFLTEGEAKRVLQWSSINGFKSFNAWNDDIKAAYQSSCYWNILKWDCQSVLSCCKGFYVSSLGKIHQSYLYRI